MKSNAVSIRDVAAAAGVSPATVSRVMNGMRKYRPETEERVRNVARELGYSTNMAARTLVHRRSSLLGMIISDIRNMFYQDIVAAFQDQALMAGMDVIIMNTNYDSHRALNCVHRLISLQVAGVAILTNEVDTSIVELLTARDIPTICSDIVEAGRNLSIQPAELEYGVHEAVRHVLELGHERVGYISGPTHLRSARRRRQAFEDACTEAGVKWQIVDTEFTVQGGYYGASQLMKHFAPTAILGGNDMCAIGVMHWAADNGVRVPDQLSVVGYDNISFAPFTQPPLTTVALPRTEIGRITFQALKELSESETREGKSYSVRPSLIERQSTARPPQEPVAPQHA